MEIGNRVFPFIYRLDVGKPAPILLAKIDSTSYLNSVEWAPQGGWLAVFNVNSQSNAQIFFIDASGTEVSRTRTVDQPLINQVFRLKYFCLF